MSAKISEIIKKKMADLDINLSKLSHETEINQTVISYLLDGDYDRMPAGIYVKSILNRICRLLELDSKEMYKKYLSELKTAGRYMIVDNQMERTYLKHKHFHSAFYITPRMLGIAIAVILLGGLSVYFFTQAAKLFKGPQLILYEPSDEIEVTEEYIKVKGKSTSNSQVEINGQEIDLDSEGHFEKEIKLKEGLNVIKVEAVNRLDKKVELTRNVVYKIEQSNEANQTGDSTDTDIEANPGILILEVKALSSIANIRVQIDDKEAQQKAILRDSVLSFEAKDHIKLTIEQGDKVELIYNGEKVGNFPPDTRPNEREIEFKKIEEEGNESEE